MHEEPPEFSCVQGQVPEGAPEFSSSQGCVPEGISAAADGKQRRDPSLWRWKEEIEAKKGEDGDDGK